MTILCLESRHSVPGKRRFIVNFAAINHRQAMLVAMSPIGIQRFYQSQPSVAVVKTRILVLCTVVSNKMRRSRVFTADAQWGKVVEQNLIM